MINEISFFGVKHYAIPMKRIKEIFKQFGLLCFTIDEYTGFLSRPPYDVRFSPVRYKNMVGTRLTFKIEDRVQEDSIFFYEQDLIEWCYNHTNEIRKGEKVLENKRIDTFLELLDE